MARWTCPDCGRRFGRTGQGHECAPALSLEEYFSTGPERERPIFDAVWDHLSTLTSELGDDGDDDGVYVEPVSVGIFFKGTTVFAQLRPMTRWVALGFNLRRRVVSERLSRKVIAHGSRYYHVVNLNGPDDVDETIRGWLTEAYLDDRG